MKKNTQKTGPELNLIEFVSFEMGTLWSKGHGRGWEEAVPGLGGGRQSV